MASQMAVGIKQLASDYDKRFGYCGPSIGEPVGRDVGMMVVIPCCGEPDLPATLNSLSKCSLPKDAGVEVIVVINAREDHPSHLVEQNLKTFREASEWKRRQPTGSFRVHVVEKNALPRKTGGVGLARKIGMDEALGRFASIDRDGVLVCLDADCTVAPNYLTEIERCFAAYPFPGFASIYYEHPIETVADERARAGIVQYELHLRYYIQGLRRAGYPFAYHTVGSSMAVKASVYAKQGGMNKRKAGEDFYFIHKLAPHARHADVTSTAVYPSARTSHRVPFGTGKAMGDWLEGGRADFMTYDPRVFDDVGRFLELLQSIHDLDVSGWQPNCNDRISAYLDVHRVRAELIRMASNSSDIDGFQKHLRNWFDGFRVLKFIHFLTEHYFQRVPVVEAASRLIDPPISAPLQAETLLQHYRRLDREV